MIAVEVQSDSWLIDGQTLYYIRNGQGDITGLINSSGRAVIEYRYDTWGRDCSLLPDYQEYLELQELNPFRYRGYVYDTETGWYYLQSRYYDPEVGRFLSADVLLSTGQGVLGHNMFAYCLNNPVNRSDAGGAESDKITGEAVDSDGDGVVDYYIYTYSFYKSKYSKTATTGRVFITVNDNFTKPKDFRLRRDIIIKDRLNGRNPTLFAMNAHLLAEDNRGYVVDIMLQYCEDMGVDWGRTKDSLMVEWESHMNYWFFPSAQDVDFDREEEGFTAEDYHDKAVSRLKSIIEGFLIRGM